MKSDAITPNFFFNNIPSFQDADKEAERKGVTDEELAISTMSKSKGWLIMEEFINNVSRELNEVNRKAIESGASLEDIGRNTVVISLAQEMITKILNKVTDAVDACEGEQQ